MPPASSEESKEAKESQQKSPQVDRRLISIWSTMTAEEQEYNQGHLQTQHFQTRSLEMEPCLQFFCCQKLGHSSCGVEGGIICAFGDAEDQHYCDSCVQIYGKERLDILIVQGWCKHCLENYPVNRAHKFARKPWHSERLKCTIIEDLLSKDGGYHRKVCNKWDAKAKARMWILTAKKEL
ncbi:hypothetical protein RB195_022164 [Necator americanus]|uniref:Uncharacterized protein n=1 Tax=Necator americanus TaxID=51031 RepID=A0ABR1EE79_NECAM